MLLRDVVEDEAGRAVIALLRMLAIPEPDPEATQAIVAAYGHAFMALATVASDERLPGIDDAWPVHLVTRVLDNANPWSLQAERNGARGVATGLHEQARRDLRALRLLWRIDAETILDLVQQSVAQALPLLADAWVPWCSLAPNGPPDLAPTMHDRLRHELLAADDPGVLAGELESYWSQHGTGLVARYTVLRWDGRRHALQGVPHSDPVRLAELVGYEREQSLLTTNVERFLAGLPAHDALLYGPPGTGKSSTVKAIGNEYGDRGLRLLEVHKEDLRALPAIAAAVRGRAPRFLVFVDDLSFEEHETEYKALKATLEGTAEQRPDNLLIYATTNRRNLIRESFADRGSPEDIHGRDTLQEKVSLAARFGLRVTFPLPDQARYLRIAEALARGRGIAADAEEVRARALAWERQHGSRSGRTARQFIDDYESSLRLHIN